MTAQDVITKVRIILSDHLGDRYSDTSLISLLNDAVRAFYIDTKLHKDIYYIELDAATTTYDMSDKLLEINRAQYKGIVLPIVSHDHMDKLNSSWQLEEGSDVKAIVIDKTRRGIFRVYPKLTTTTIVSDVNSFYGVLIEFDLSYEPNYLTIADLPLTSEYLSIYGITKPAPILLVGDVIDIDDQWIGILAHHISGSALRLDQDTQNRTVGNEELMIYSSSVLGIKNEVAQNFTDADLEITYRRT